MIVWAQQKGHADRETLFSVATAAEGVEAGKCAMAIRRLGRAMTVTALS